MKVEIWKDIPGYEGLYQASTLGRIRSLDRVIEVKIDGMVQKRSILGTILCGGHNGHGYLFVYLCRNGKAKRYYIHRIIAKTFIPNPQNYPYINHKDENPGNNCVDNLEWCTQKYNANYGSHIEKVRAYMLSDKNPNRGKPRPEKFKEKVRKPILQLDRDGNVIREWDSARTAGTVLGIFPQVITAVCKGRCLSYKNFIWKYKDDHTNAGSAEK